MISTTDTVCLVLPGPKLHPSECDIYSVTMEISQAPSLGKVPLASLFTWEQSGDRVLAHQEQSEDMVHTLACTAQCLHQQPSIIHTMCCTHRGLGLLCNRSSCSCQEKNLCVFPELDLKLKGWQCGSQGREAGFLLF